jgi:hypothetical protein
MYLKNIKKSWIAILIIAILVVMVSGCTLRNIMANQTLTPTGEDQQTDLEQVSSELEIMQSVWEAQGLESYRFQFHWQCFCLPDYLETVWVTVEDGEIASVEAVDPNFEGNLPDRSEFRTIDGLFELIREAIEGQAYQIRVTYDDTIGYPASAYIDYDAAIADEERGFEILEFETHTPAPTETSQPTGSEPEIEIDPRSGPPGTEIRVTVNGFPSNIPVNIGVGRVNSEFDVITSTRTDQNGAIEITVALPSFVTPEDEWVIVASAVEQDITAISDTFDVTEGPEGSDSLFTRANIYLIAIGDNGLSGKKIGCNDSVVPVEIEIEPTPGAAHCRIDSYAGIGIAELR